MANLKRETRTRLGLDRYLDPNLSWTKYDNAEVAQKARACAQQVKLILGLGNLDAISDTQIVHQLLSQLGLKVNFHWSKAVPGHEGEKLRVYQLDPNQWQEDLAVLQQRSSRRTQEGVGFSSGSPSSCFEIKNVGGDPAVAQAEPGWNQKSCCSDPSNEQCEDRKSEIDWLSPTFPWRKT